MSLIERATPVLDKSYTVNVAYLLIDDFYRENKALIMKLI